MKIEINEEALQSAMDRGIERTIDAVIDSRSVQEQMHRLMSDEVMAGTLRSAAKSALEQMDAGKLGEQLADVLSRAIILGASRMVIRALASTTMKLSGRRDYEDGYQADYEGLIAEMEASMGLSE